MCSRQWCKPNEWIVYEQLEKPLRIATILRRPHLPDHDRNIQNEIKGAVYSQLPPLQHQVPEGALGTGA